MEPTTKHFFSKSRDAADLGPGIQANWRKVLSNFHPTHFTVDGHTYHTPEHAFHAAKSRCSNDSSMAELFTLGGDVGPLPADAKLMGGRKMYKQRGAVLNTTLWNLERDNAQRAIIEARLQQDELFRLILMAVDAQNVRLVLFERAGSINNQRRGACARASAYITIAGQFD